MRFLWSTPAQWVWLHKEDPPAGAYTDGVTNALVDDGVARLVTDEGMAYITHRLTNLFNPPNYDFSDWEAGSVSSLHSLGRDAWLISAAREESQLEVLFDKDSGVLLFMRDDNSYLGFEELELDVDTEPNDFRWHGPVEERMIGHALLIPEETGYSVQWDVSIRGRGMFNLQSPLCTSKDEAMAWAESRAVTVRLRPE